ncbi:hypothetical protein OEA41_001036 [Lepraria neglecta]|uniref:Uncharacterized protein n=1 Tax=Lepraria neglecta TaxID=209136 RepID=A0AAE0DQ03_9LECA|nr:hypothetical protein OEA41_001036 [Lepraria neglecta]
MAGVQVCGYYFNSGQQSQAVSLRTLIMGLIGYCGILVFTFALLIMVEREIEIDPQTLLPVFDNAIWTFADSRHAEHRKFDKSPDHNFVQAAPERSKPSSTREIMTACVCTALVGSYVVYCLGVRVAQCIELQKQKKERSCTIVVAKPIRQSLRNWSGCEDIMKVALEMAKHAGEDRAFSPAGQVFRVPNMPAFKRIIRFQLMTYVPGVVWKADAELDYILTESLDLPNLCRDVMKIFHLCGHMNGSIVSRQILKKQEKAEISNVLCGPVTIPGENGLLDLPSSLTLVDLLCVLRDLNRPHIKAYTLEQALLLPTIQLALIHPEVARDFVRDVYNPSINHIKDSKSTFCLDKTLA